MKIAIIGLGAIGKTHHAMLAQHTDNPAEIICDTNPSCLENIEAKTKTTNPEQAIQMADTVIIATPTHTHAELALIAVESKKAVFCQKPLASNLKEARMIVAAVKKQSVPFQVGYIMRFSSAWKQIQEMLNKLGCPAFWREIWHINGQSYPGWLSEKEGGGPIFEDSHRFEFLCSAFGKPLSTFGYVNNFTPKFRDTFATMIKFEKGTAIWSDSWARTSPGESNRVPRVTFDAIGPQGHIVHPVRTNSTVLYDSNGHELQSIDWDHLGISGYEEEMRAFLRYVNGGKNEGCSIEDAAQVVALIEAILLSSNGNHVTQVESIL